MSGGEKVTLGPLLFNWPAEDVVEFYARIAELAPVDTVHLGEVVCPKRLPLLGEAMVESAEILKEAGIEVVWSTLGLIADALDMAAVRTVLEGTEGLVEINDVTTVPLLEGRPFAVGPLVNVYNERTLQWLVERGAVRACLPPELSRNSLAALARLAGDVELEFQVFGRMPLALSARCYHARVHGLHKDGCQYVCEGDPDGMPVETLDGQSFLAVNGIQTLSHAILDLSAEMDELLELGVRRFRLSPQYIDMVAVTHVWRDLLDGRRDLPQAQRIIGAVASFAPRANGYFHGRSGAELIV